jgi:hypothetical protein
VAVPELASSAAFSGRRERVLALKDLFPEISSAIGTRLYQTQRLFWALKSQSEAVEERVKLYDAAVTEWSGRLGSFYARLTINANYKYTLDLERKLHIPFQAIGAQLEAEVRRRRAGGTITKTKTDALEKELTALSGSQVSYSRDLLSAVEDKRKSVYFGRRIPFNERTMTKLSNWELIKALFIRDIDSHAVVRSTTDL